MSEFSHRSLQGAKAGRRRLFAATALVLFLVLADAVTHGSVRSAIRSGAAGIWGASAQVRASISESGYFRSHRSLAKENASLRADLAQYQEKAAGYDVLTEENAQLRDALHFSKAEKGVTAPVVSSFASSPYGTFMIGAGTGDPVQKGDLILSDGGFVVGTIADVGAQVAEVRSIFSAGERTDALIGKTAVAVIGDGGGNAHASVPLGITFAVGDPIVSSRYGGRAIGIIGSISSSATSPDQTLYIRLPVSLASLRYVYIVHK